MDGQSLSDLREAVALLEAGATDQPLAEMLEGVTITLAGIYEGPADWEIAPELAHLFQGIAPALVRERLTRSQRILRLAGGVSGAAIPDS